MWKDLGPHGAEKEFLAVIYGFWRRSKTPVEIPSRTVTEITGLSRTSVIMAKRALLKKEIVAAQEIRGKPSRYEEFLRAKYLFLDELGAEPERCQSYGTDYTPVQNLISYRYDRKLPTIITTNLADDKILDRYGTRMMDRINEMFSPSSGSRAIPIGSNEWHTPHVFRGDALPKHYASCADVEQFRFAIVQLPAGNPCSQARIRGGIYTPFGMKQKYFDPNNFKVNKTRRMRFRATQQEQITIQAKAQACGKSVSEYIRQSALGHKPKLRMTRSQAQAYISISEARGDLIHIKNALNAMSQEDRVRCFADPYFMRRWISGANKLIKRWREIERTLTE